MSSFERYLASQRYCGDLDSADAQFTLSLDKALKKLRHHSLAEGEWILKVVQTANSAQAKALCIKQDRLFSYIELLEATDVPPRTELRAELEVLGSSSNSTAKEFLLEQLELGFQEISEALHRPAKD